MSHRAFTYAPAQRRVRSSAAARGIDGRGVRRRDLHAEMLHLQATAGNAAVGALLRRCGPTLLQRKPKEQAGWPDADPAVDPATSFSWNKEKHFVGSIGRYPLAGLPEGNQRKWLEGWSKTVTVEPANGRAIALVTKEPPFDPKKPVLVLVHLHGYAEQSVRPYPGWRQHSTTHKVRDVEHDRIAQQIEEANNPQIIGVLPQGGEQSDFGTDKDDPYNTFASDNYIRDVLKKLADVWAYT